MNREVQLKAEQLNKRRKHRNIWYRILSVPVCIVVFVTTYAMILPAITLESTPDTYCGLEEHIHVDECYETPSMPAHKEIKCSAADNLVEGEYIVHTHNSFCFDDKGELICGLEEQSEHNHTGECYENGKLVCEKQTPVIHQHTAECVVTVPATEPQGLICTKTEHRHTESCFINPESRLLNTAALTASETQPDGKTDNDSTSAAVKNEKEVYTQNGTTTIFRSSYSDKATSKIESEFTGVQTDDGKVVTDKTVIYGKDDYSAFTTYNQNTFSVVLSALGQQYENTDTTVIKTPLDIVFILDTSGSMVAGGISRASDAVKTLNELAKYVMELNSENRFGVATFSSDYDNTYNNGFDSNELLPIGSYENAKTDDILTYTAGTSRQSYYNATVKVNTSVSGTSNANSTYFYGGTYTTAGYYEAAEMLKNTTGKTVTVNGQEIERVPIIILITDGATTFSSGGTNKYEYSSTQDGSGSSMSNNNLFYTILSAYHYKAQVSEAYFDNAKMYTVGIGDDAASLENLANLNPTEENLNNITSNTYRTAKSNLLNKSGFPSSYTSRHGTEYYFCDGTYTSENFDPLLTAKLKEFIRENAGEYIYSSSSRTQTNIEMTDIIGSGMELKSGFVLRYDGTNYPLTLTGTSGGVSTYKYTGSVTVKANQYGDPVSLSEITVTVDTTGGNQRITWDLPSSLLPEYTHAKTGNWYYPMLPVRLLYQVGLTEESEQAVKNLTDTSGEITFYANAYGAGINNAVAVVEPTEAQGNISENPYYLNYTGETKGKDENTTLTRSAYRESSKSGEKITFVMGNNGKLVFSANTRTLDGTSAKTSVVAKKVWKDKNGSEITDTAVLPEITAVAKADGIIKYTAVLNAANEWTHTFDNLPTEWDDGTEITWTVDEEFVPSGYEKEIVEDSSATTTSGGSSTVTALEDGGIYIFRRQGSTYAIKNPSGNTVSSATGEDTDASIQWKAIAQSNGKFRLQNVSTGNYLAVYSSSFGWWSSYSVTADGGSSSNYSYDFLLTDGRLQVSIGSSTRYITVTTGYSASIGTTTSSTNSNTNLTVTKVGSSARTFTITNKEKSTAALTVTKTVRAPDTNGEFNFEISVDGGTSVSFTLKNGETYMLDNIAIGSQVTVKELNSDGYSVSFIKDGEIKQSGVESYTFTADGDISLTVQNTAGVELPETGGRGIYLWIYGGLGIMLGAVVTGYFLRRRYRKEGN